MTAGNQGAAAGTATSPPGTIVTKNAGGATVVRTGSGTLVVTSSNSQVTVGA